MARKSIAPPEIKKQLDRIITNTEFLASEQQTNFLKYIVLEALAGNKSNLKGFKIATKVFGRPQDFDAATDPIVSIQAGKLRRALERYYLTAGQDDEIVIDIPKGAYIPRFTRNSDPYPHLGKNLDKYAAMLSAEWPTMEIVPFSNLTGDPNNDFLGNILATKISVEIGRTFETRVIMAANQNSNDTKIARFVLTGTIYNDEDGIATTAHLVDNLTGEQVFGNTYKANVDAVQYLAHQKEIAVKITANICSEHGVITKLLVKEAQTKPIEDLTPYESILAFYDFDQDSTPEKAQRAFASLKNSTEKYPDVSLTWTFLARLYSNYYTFGIPGFENILDEALGAALNGVRLNPNSQRALVILAWVHFQKDDLESARNHLQRALDLCSDTLVTTDHIGYVYTLSGEWDKGVSLIRRAMRANPYYASHVHYALWLDCLRKKQYEQAYLETTGIIRSSIFWHPLAIGATLGLMDRVEEAQTQIERLLALKPEFPEQGRDLIRKYIKFQDLQDTVIHGLKKAGLDLV